MIGSHPESRESSQPGKRIALPRLQRPNTTSANRKPYIRTSAPTAERNPHSFSFLGFSLLMNQRVVLRSDY